MDMGSYWLGIGLPKAFVGTSGPFQTPLLFAPDAMTPGYPESTYRIQGN